MNNNTFEFSKVVYPEWKEIMKTLNLKESLEYLRDSQDKILFAILDMNFFYHIVRENKKAYQHWNTQLFKNGQISELPKSSPK